MKTILTNEGRKMLAKILDGAAIRFTHAEFGDGQWTTQDETTLRNEIATATSLQHKVVTTDFDNTDDIATVNDGVGEVVVHDGFVLLRSSFLNTNISSGFHVTEIGYYVRDLTATDDPETEEDETDPVLYAVCVRDISEAPYVAPASMEAATFKHGCHIYVGDEADVTAIISANMEEVSKPYVDKHINDMENPHNTTKEQVGLGSVPNVDTHDQRPAFSESGIFENIDGTVQADGYGKETLSTLFGKIQKAISTLIAHLANKNNPHDVTAAQISAAAVKHYHSASTDFNDGVLPVVRGGTGESEGVWFDNSTPLYNNRDCGVTLWREYCWNGSSNGRMLKQGGFVNCDSGRVFVKFNKPYKNTRYTLTFQTSYSGLIPLWKNVEKHTDGFYMNRTIGIDSTPIKNMLKGLFSLPSQSGIRDKIDELFGASQAADWTAIGPAG